MRRLWTHLHDLDGWLRTSDLRDACVEVVEAHVRAADDEWRAECTVQERVAELHDGEVCVPELVVWPLRGCPRAKQVDGAKVPHTIALELALDAIIVWVPSAVLRLVGNAQVNLRAPWRGANVANIDLVRGGRAGGAVGAQSRTRGALASPALPAEVGAYELGCVEDDCGECELWRACERGLRE